MSDVTTKDNGPVKSKYVAGEIINGHKIISRTGRDSFLVNCGNCGGITNKSRSNITRNKRCTRCKRGTSKSEIHIKTMCWILGLNEDVVRSRITKGMTTKEALYFKGKIPKESFRDYDLIYISKINEENYKEDNRMEEKAYLSYKTRINKNY